MTFALPSGLDDSSDIVRRQAGTGPSLSVSLLVAFLLFAVGSVILLATGHHDYFVLHAVMDTMLFLVSGILALLLWDLATRTGQSFPRLLAITFSLTSLYELVHALLPFEWSTAFLSGEDGSRYMPHGSWAPPAYLLPLGVVAALLLFRKRRGSAKFFGLGLILASAILFALLLGRAPYTSPQWLGVTRPVLILVPFLWLFVAGYAWRVRRQTSLGRVLAAASLLFLLASVFMLYSRASYDSIAMVGHLGKVLAGLLILVSLAQMGTADTVRRIQAEQALKELNEALEARVRERTADLENANGALKSEIASREQTEHKLQIQLERLNLLHQITRAIGERQDLQSIFQVVVRSLEDYLSVDFSCICLHDRTNDTLVVTRIGVKSEALAMALAMSEQARVPIDQNGLSRCLSGHLVYEPDIGSVQFPFPQRLARGGLGALVIAPLQAHNDVFGVMVTARRAPRSFSSSDCEFLLQLSEHVALAAKQSQLYGTLQRAHDDLHQSQQVAMQQERLRALGQMASGIAHDINNAVSPIALYAARLLDKEPNLTPRGREQLNIISHAIQDVAATVTRMREFSRPREWQSELKPVDLNKLVPQVKNLTRARWSDLPMQRGAMVEFLTDLTDDEPLVLGVENEIRDILTNLIFNAVDAMPNGGALTLRTRGAGSGPAQGSRRVCLEVADTGGGMSEETRRRCLEPFFTTKGERGTGLGLAMVYGAAQRHNATIEIESVENEGTTVRLSFPVPEAAAPAPEAARFGARIPSRMRILLVDDDPLVLMSLKETLEDDGHIITAVNGGQEGIDTFRAALAGGTPFDAVITDLGMPRVNGRMVAAEVKAASSGTPVIMLTGWGEQLSSESSLPSHVDRMLSKPPRLRELQQALAYVFGAEFRGE